MALTPADVRNKVFSSARLKRGYSEEEVDAFLDEVEAELSRLSSENNDLRSRLSAVLAGASSMSRPEYALPAASSVGGLALDAELADPRIIASVRVLTMAQKTADDAVAEARAEAAALLRDAGATVERTLVESRDQATERLVAARAEAASVTEDARATRARVLNELAGERDRLQSQISGLRTFEREYRTRLRTLLTERLRELDTVGEVTTTDPISSGPTSGFSPGRSLERPVERPDSPQPFYASQTASIDNGTAMRLPLING